jgi:thioredoxin-related protein
LWCQGNEIRAIETFIREIYTPEYMKKAIILGLLVLLAFVVGCSETPTAEVVVDTEDYDAFAQWLTDENIVMIGAEWCGYCNQQKTDFGDSFQYVTFIDAVYEAELAASYGVSGYPTWVLADGTQLAGYRPIENLMEETGYL